MVQTSHIQAGVRWLTCSRIYSIQDPARNWRLQFLAILRAAALLKHRERRGKVHQTGSTWRGRMPVSRSLRKRWHAVVHIHGRIDRGYALISSKNCDRRTRVGMWCQTPGGRSAIEATAFFRRLRASRLKTKRALRRFLDEGPYLPKEQA